MIRRTLLPLLLLAACASPEERCISDSLEELRRIDGLIAETRANVERGYAIEELPVSTVGFVICTNPSDNFGLCAERESRVRTRPVAIDIAAERRKLAALEARRPSVAATAERAVAACRQIYAVPAGG